jgi:hypothetical protein
LTPTVDQLDARRTMIRADVEKATELVLDSAIEHTNHRSDRTFRKLQEAVAAFNAADQADLEHMRQLGDALRRERAWTPDPDRRATWETP